MEGLCPGLTECWEVFYTHAPRAARVTFCDIQPTVNTSVLSRLGICLFLL